MSKKRQHPAMKVQCAECDRIFKTRLWEPQCPSCGSYDIDICSHPEYYTKPKANSVEQ